MPDTEMITLPSGHTATLRTDVLYGDDMDLDGLATALAQGARISQSVTANGRQAGDIPQPGTVATESREGLTIDAVGPDGKPMGFQVTAEAIAAQVEGSKFFPLCCLIESWDFDLPIPGIIRGLPRTIRGRVIPGSVLGIDTESLRQIPRLDGAKLQEEATRIWNEAHPDFSAVPTEDAESPFTSSSGSEP